jgi:prepilin-type N-terminal cleavage/methylation domain-containing protein/prepilin-type processing-associated H-X9-DG protein
MKLPSGFTLVELLVTIAVLGMLMALLFAVFPKVREMARSTTCLSNQRQIAMAILMYVSDSQETFPPNDNDPWPGKVTQYGAEPKVFDCPSETGLGTMTQSDYAMNAAVAGKRMAEIDEPARTVLTVDARPGTDFFTDRAEYAGRHLNRCNVSYADGHSGSLVP